MRMSFSESVRFPFRNSNLLKVLPLAIVQGIVIFLISYGTVEMKTEFAVLGYIGSLIFSLIIGGFYVSVIRSVQRGNERLPDVNITRDTKQGCMSIVAGFVYFLVPIIGFAILFALIGGMSSATMMNSGNSDGVFLLACGLGIVAFIAAIVLSAGWIVGLLRYADEESSSAFLAVSDNLNTAWRNLGKFFGMWFRALGIGLLSGIIGGVLQVFFSSLVQGFYVPYTEQSTIFWLFYALGDVAVTTVQIAFIMSQYHLMAHLGFELDIGRPEPRKQKREPQTF